jgi:ketosteroid isomerase-like protein
MKIITYLIAAACLVSSCNTCPTGVTDSYRKPFDKTIAAFGDAFARGDVPAIMALHHPDVIKYFGGNNVIKGRAAVGKALAETFKVSKLEFVENKVESTLFNGETVIESRIFTIKVTPKNGGQPTYAHGRSMVMYVRYKDSPYGWVSIREMAQAAP